MRIMHLGDLHIGKTLNQQSLLNEQSQLLDELVKQVEALCVDIIVIAGDIYDRSIPSKEAMGIYETFIYNLNQKLQKPVLIISGNHDSPERLGHGKAWMKMLNLYISTSIEDAFVPVSIDNIDFYLVPFIEPATARLYFEDDTIKTHHDTYQAIINRIEERINNAKLNIMVSHLFVSGGNTTDSEREISVGAIENVHLDLFKSFDYVMLGHLHTPDAIKDDKVFYSGSIMKYSFDEVHQRKGFRIFDTEEKSVQFIPLNPPRNLEYAEGTYDDAINKSLGVSQDSYLKFELSNMGHVTEPMFKLKQIYPYLLELKHKTEKLKIEYQQKEVQYLSQTELVKQFYFDMTDEPLNDVQQELIDLLINESRMNDETD
ncbi:metallophosphoesterase family protein [Macrococcus armenti]|uniref:metallophosphoesterase family protein n=1 Tax=Macrococcus armenti TaxID=2875764 RepID=UPI001CC90FF3|nr:exonuclease SbcCD subunit D [Macrococcus armenti]UBH09644.1 exonuclease SbcCD subunit D [Macrococcus armenti]UBH11918.1 exonuclease SbcCD subunit D [Macrococcus armenti]